MIKSIIQFLVIYLIFISIFSCTTSETTPNKSKAESYKEFVAKMHQKGFTTGNILNSGMVSGMYFIPT